MRKAFWVFLLLFLTSGAVFAYSIKEKVTLKNEDFEKILPGKFVSIPTATYCRGTGNLFMLARDKKTRRLDWFLINPVTKKVLKSGACPFKAFRRVRISPNEETAVVQAHFPQSLWTINLGMKKCSMLYKNPEKAGLSLGEITPLAFVDTYWVFTIMDDRDAEGFISNSFLVFFNPLTKKVFKMVTMRELMNISLKNIFNNNPPAWVNPAITMIVPDTSLSFAYVLSIKNKDKKFKNYLFMYETDKKTSSIKPIDESNAGILLMDYRRDPIRFLYRKLQDKKEELIFTKVEKKFVPLSFEGDKHPQVAHARILPNDVLAVLTIEEKKYELYLGQGESKVEKVKTFSTVSAAGFLDNGTGMIFINDNAISVFDIIP